MKEAPTDLDFLREFVEANSDTAFTELVRRHIDLVYSAALRQLRGDSHLARDATQAVFCELARSARKLIGHRTLIGWLYTTTRFVASRMERSEIRRATREQAFAMKQIEESGTGTGWNDVEHLLDDAMQDLPAEDREAVLLRYFRNESFGAIGAALGASENAARMRVDRALEKLRTALGRRGVTCPSAALSGLLLAKAVSSAPVGLAATIAAPALASSAVALPGAIKLLEIMATTKIKAAVAVIALAGTTTGWIVTQRNSSHLETEIARLRQEASMQLSTNVPEADGTNPEDPVRLRAERNELMRLRGEVTDLRRQLREKPAAVPAPATTRETATVEMTPEEQAKDELKTRGIAKLNIAKVWGIGFSQFALANNGQMPADFQQAQHHSPEISETLLKFAAEGGVGGASGDGFEITFQGRLDQIENPGHAIIMREQEPFHFGDDGSAQRTYLFADGHSEIHRARDGNFERWEEERRPKLKQEGTPAPLQNE